jgi:predicted acylesterase/phospholipase RssA
MLKRNITKLLICGGGFKMFYLVGAIKYLIEIDVLQNIKEYIGVSAGSILAFLFLIGYTTNELNSFFLEFNFEKLIAPNLDTFFDTKGLDNGDNKKIALEQFMKKKGIKPDITFLELYQLTNKKLSLIVSNISKNQIEIINHETYPDMLITKGLIMTSALPILFEPVIYNNDHFVDGGVFDNYPIDLFNDDEILGINMTVDVSDLNFDIEFFSYNKLL